MYMKIFEDMMDVMVALPKDLCGELVQVMIEYKRTGLIPDGMSAALVIAWPMIKRTMDAMEESEEKITHQRKNAAAARWKKQKQDTNGIQADTENIRNDAKSIRDDADACENMRNDTEQEQEQEQEQEHVKSSGEEEEEDEDVTTNAGGRAREAIDLSWRHYLGRPASPAIRESIARTALGLGFGPDVIEEAIRLAATKGVSDVPDYVRKVLRDWSENGVRDGLSAGRYLFLRDVAAGRDNDVLTREEGIRLLDDFRRNGPYESQSG